MTKTRSGRFIDFAHHGGCSQKLEPTRLRALLQPLALASPGAGSWPDAGITVVGDQTFASSVDVVLPMIDDSELFGRIVATHVLSDLYATGVRPVHALNILSVPDGLFGAEGSSTKQIDAEIQRMLVAANEVVTEAGAIPVGGHTLSFDVLFFGMAATGIAVGGRTIGNHTGQPGDRLLLTKPVGTSVATKAWKVSDAAPRAFQDVLNGMLLSNRAASEAMLRLDRCACTDVTGFGFFGHLHNLLEASEVGARVQVADIPVYPSALEAVDPDSATRILGANREFAEPHLENGEILSVEDRLLFMDAQVSGGLLVSLPPGDVDAFQAMLGEMGEEAWDVGQITDGSPGEITLE